jgi:hypothetical protein
LTPKRRHQFQCLTHAYHNENAALVCIQQGEVTACKRAREEEEEKKKKKKKIPPKDYGKATKSYCGTSVVMRQGAGLALGTADECLVVSRRPNSFLSPWYLRWNS